MHSSVPQKALTGFPRVQSDTCSPVPAGTPGNSGVEEMGGGVHVRWPLFLQRFHAHVPATCRSPWAGLFTWNLFYLLLPRVERLILLPASVQLSLPLGDLVHVLPLSPPAEAQHPAGPGPAMRCPLPWSTEGRDGLQPQQPPVAEVAYARAGVASGEGMTEVPQGVARQGKECCSFPSCLPQSLPKLLNPEKWKGGGQVAPGASDGLCVLCLSCPQDRPVPAGWPLLLVCGGRRQRGARQQAAWAARRL